MSACIPCWVSSWCFKPPVFLHLVFPWWVWSDLPSSWFLRREVQDQLLRCRGNAELKTASHAASSVTSKPKHNLHNHRGEHDHRCWHSPEMRGLSDGKITNLNWAAYCWKANLAEMRADARKLGLCQEIKREGIFVLKRPPLISWLAELRLSCL